MDYPYPEESIAEAAGLPRKDIAAIRAEMGDDLCGRDDRRRVAFSESGLLAVEERLGVSLDRNRLTKKKRASTGVVVRLFANRLRYMDVRIPEGEVLHVKVRGTKNASGQWLFRVGQEVPVKCLREKPPLWVLACSHPSRPGKMLEVTR